MDVSEEAALYLTSIFERMEVPCRVNYTSDKGKHVVATADIPARKDLFEEVPIVSWPAQGYVALGIPFCSYCLRQQEKLDALKMGGNAPWRVCDSCGVLFCSLKCESSGKAVHSILCSALRELREEKDSGHPHVDAGGISYKPITEESLARCVACVVARIATSIRQQQFSGELLETSHIQEVNSIAKRLFHLACAPFNRLVDAPQNTEFCDVDATAMYCTVGRLLRGPCRIALLEATAAPHSINEDWALEIVDALLRHDTLETFLGQLTLNSQAINGFVVSLPLGEGASTGITPVQWLLKGGGVYTLQSAFNHSCDPNTVVSMVDCTHNIIIRTLRPVSKGEELTITYIPLENTTHDQRQAMLEGYFFTCRCHRCEKERVTRKEKMMMGTTK